MKADLWRHGYTDGCDSETVLGEQDAMAEERRIKIGMPSADFERAMEAEVERVGERIEWIIRRREEERRGE